MGGGGSRMWVATHTAHVSNAVKVVLTLIRLFLKRIRGGSAHEDAIPIRG